MIDGRIITVTTKGQIAIPKEVRKELNIDNGSKLFVYVYGDTIMMKVLKLPNPEEFKRKLDEAEKWAESVGLTEEEVNRVIKEVRQGK